MLRFLAVLLACWIGVASANEEAVVVKCMGNSVYIVWMVNGLTGSGPGSPNVSCENTVNGYIIGGFRLQKVVNDQVGTITYALVKNS